MLNPLLYKTLVKLFGKVVIANEGQHAHVVEDRTKISHWTIPPDYSHGEQYRVNCPFCGDHKKHLYISYLSYARPVLDGRTLAVGPLRCQCFKSNCTAMRENRDYLEGLIGRQQLAMDALDEDAPSIICDLVDDEPEQTYKVSNDITLEGFRTWVPDYAPVDENTPQEIIEYLNSRRVTQDDVDWMHIGWGPIKSPRSGTYLNSGFPWIIFPIINNGKLMGVQARCLPQHLKEKGIKYWLHPGCRKSTVVANLDVARQLGVGVICEGVFDLLSIGKPGICCFGHTPSEAQRRLIATFSQCMLWCPDTDVTAKLNPIGIAQKICMQWNSLGIFPQGAHVIQLPKKDAGEMTREEIWTTIIEQVPEQTRDFLLRTIIPKL